MDMAATEMGVRALTRFGTTVVKAERSGELWKLTLSQGGKTTQVYHSPPASSVRYPSDCPVTECAFPVFRLERCVKEVFDYFLICNGHHEARLVPPELREKFPLLDKECLRSYVAHDVR
eukprot:2868921-Amphidinium_carterae.1